jgi:hypothetical protein
MMNSAITYIEIFNNINYEFLLIKLIYIYRVYDYIL